MLKKFSQWLGGLAAPAEGAGAPCAQLCLFGKHPGWDDHMQDMGLATERLVDVRRTLYAEGLAGNIDSGAWEKLGPGALAEFDHAFVWRFRGDEFVFGRMWSSSDARGRKKYPMVACVHAAGHDLARMASLASESVTRVMEMVRQERDAQAVRAAFVRESEGLSARASALPPGGVAQFDQTCLRAVGADHDLTLDNSLALVRAAYALHREAEPVLKRGLSHASRGVHLRVPCVRGMGGGGSAWAWSSAALDFLGVPAGLPDGLLAIEALGGSWVDVLIGRVSATELVCLRAGLGAIANTTDVPFTIEDAFADRVRSRASMWRGSSADPPGARDG